MEWFFLANVCFYILPVVQESWRYEADGGTCKLLVSGDENKLSKDFQFLFHYMIHCGVCGFTWKDKVLTMYYIYCLCIMLNSMVMVKLELLFEGWGRIEAVLWMMFFHCMAVPHLSDWKRIFLSHTCCFVYVTKVSVFGINFNSCRCCVFVFMNLVIFSYGTAMPSENYC